MTKFIIVKNGKQVGPHTYDSYDDAEGAIDCMCQWSEDGENSVRGLSIEEMQS